MPAPCPHHCPPDNSGAGLIAAVLAIAAVVIVVAKAAASAQAATAMAELVHLVILTLTVAGSAAVTGLAIYLGARHRRRIAAAARAARRAVRRTPAPQAIAGTPVPSRRPLQLEQGHAGITGLEALTAITAEVLDAQGRR